MGLSDVWAGNHSRRIPWELVLNLCPKDLLTGKKGDVDTANGESGGFGVPQEGQEGTTPKTGGPRTLWVVNNGMKWVQD